MARHLLVVLGFALSCLAFATPAAAQDSVIYVANPGSLLIVDTTTYSTVATIPVPAYPGDGYGMVVTPDGHLAYITSGANNTTTVVNTIKKSVVATIPGSFPDYLVSAADGSRVYISNSGSNSIAVVSTATNAIIASISLPAGPGGIGITPDGKYLYVNAGGTVYVVDTATYLVTSTIPIAGSSGDIRKIAFTPDGTRAYVVGPYIGVVVIDTASNTIVTTISGFVLPVNVAVTPDGTRLYVCSSYGPVSAVDTTTNTIVANVTVDGHPYGIAIRSDGAYVYVTNIVDSVYEISTATNTVHAAIPLPRPDWVAIANPTSSACPGGLSITSIQPTSGGNAGSVTPTVLGCGFEAGATLKLRRSGQPDIVAGLSGIGPSFTTLTGTFNLNGSSTGAWDVVVTNPDATSATLPAAFVIKPGGAAELSVNIIGRTNVRFGKPQTYVLELVNAGTVDSSPGNVAFAIPSNVSYQQLNGTSLFPAGSTSSQEFGIPTSSSNAGTNQILFATPGVPAGGVQTAPVQLTLPFNVTPSQFTVTAGWQPNLLSLPFDQYVIARGVPYIPFNSSCPRCYAQAVTQVNAITDAQTAYTAYQNAERDKEFAVAKLAVALGQAAYGLFSPLEDAITKVTDKTFQLLATNLLSQATNASGALAGDSASSVLQQLGVTDLALIGKATALLPGVPPPLGVLLSNIITKLETLNSVLSSVNSYLDAVNTAQSARASFFPFFDAYQAARLQYQACLNQYCGGTPPPPPPPSLPGTGSLPINGVSSFDPNDKNGPIGVTSQRYVSGAAGLAYSIDFENKASATAPAQEVVVTDPLDLSTFDISTVTLGPITFSGQALSSPLLPLVALGTFSASVDLRPATNLLVQVTASLNSQTGVLTWTLQSIDPTTGQPPSDPLSGFLPPGSGGAVSFSAKTKGSLLTGVAVSNQAAVVFDTNPAISTPTWSNAIDATAPQSSVVALPATETLPDFTVNWQGSDVGSGIQDFTIYVSDNGSPFTSWLAQTNATQAIYSGQRGHVYQFYSLAQDQVGLMEYPKTTAEAMTTVNSQPTCSFDVSPQFAVVRGGFRFNNATKHFVQSVTITNVGVNLGPLQGPFAFAVDSLNSNASLFSPSGTTACSLPSGSPYLTLNPGGQEWSTGQNITVVLEFVDPTYAGITYKTRVLAGSTNQ